MKIYAHSCFGERIELDVSKNITVRDLKNIIKNKIRQIRGSIYSMNDMKIYYCGDVLDDYEMTLQDCDIEDGSIISFPIFDGGGSENSDYSTNINAVNKRENVGNIYSYMIKGSNEGTVWGDHIYTDDSNIAMAAVLEGKCQLGEEKTVNIKMIEGKSSYSSANKNGVSSVTYGSWPASYIFL